MTRAEILKLWPNASESTIQRNLAADSPPPSPVIEPPVCHALPSAVPGKKGDSPRYVVRITSFRRRLCDPDNLCGKYFVDCLRYAGLIPDDTAAIMDYRIQQQKTKRKEDERTEIEVQEVQEMNGVEAASHFAQVYADLESQKGGNG